MARDLDAARAARREALGEAPSFILFGVEWTMPVELPLEIAIAFSELAGKSEQEANAEAVRTMLGAIETLLGDQYESFQAHKPSVDDLKAIFEVIQEVYAVTPEKSVASGDSSLSNGTALRPISSASITSISGTA